MRISNHTALIAAVSLVLFHRGTAEISLTVNVSDLDPLKECNRRDVQLVESNNKVYMYGGKSWVKNGTSTPIQVTNHYLRIADFTSARNLSDPTILVAKDIPSDITIFNYGAFWGDSNKLYVVGGSVVEEPYLAQNGTFIETKYADFHGGTVFNYDIDADKWSYESASDDTVKDSFCCGAFAWNAQHRKAYYFSGSNWAGARETDPNQTPIAVGGSTSDAIANGNLLSFNTEAFKWSNQTTDYRLVPRLTQSGQFVYLPGTETSTGGVGIIFGGWQIGSDITENFQKVLVYDSGTGLWYSQATTVEGGEFPQNRFNYCVVAASASDNSSHNIYMYGGEIEGKTDSALSSMWILSIPSFHWIPVDVTSVPRKGLHCTTVAERYMVTYSGLQSGSGSGTDGDLCDQENYGLRLFDLSTLEWQSHYNGPENSKYTVPSIVYKVIGGTEDGVATQTAPSAGFNTPGLESLFKKTNTDNPSSSSPSPSSSSSPSAPTTTPGPKKSNIGALVGGIVGGIVVLATLVGAWFLLKRRKAKVPYEPAATSVLYNEDGHNLQPKELHGDSQEIKSMHEIYGREVERPPPQELYGNNMFPPQQNGGFVQQRQA